MVQRCCPEWTLCGRVCGGRRLGLASLWLAVCLWHGTWMQPVASASGNSGSSSGSGSVLGRYERLWRSGQRLAPKKPLRLQQVPTDVSDSLSQMKLSWDSLDGIGQVGLLWAHGYVLLGIDDDSSVTDGMFTTVVPVYTLCRANTKEGIQMDEIVVDDSAFSGTKCDTYDCGNVFKKTSNNNCDGPTLISRLRCAITASDLDPPVANKVVNRNSAIWSLPLVNSSDMAFPQLYAHSLGGDSSSSQSGALEVYSIQFTKGAYSPSKCEDSGDLTIPCAKISGASTAASLQNHHFCRPKVQQTELNQWVKTMATDSSSPEVSNTTTWIIVAVLAVVLLAVAIACWYWFAYRPKKRRQAGTFDAMPTPYMTRKSSHSRQYRNSSNDDNDTTVIMNNDSQLYTMMPAPLNNSMMSSTMMSMNKSTDDVMLESEILTEFVNDPIIFTKRIPYDEITYLRLLNKGASGEVWLGQLETQHVAIKRLLPDKCHQVHNVEAFAGEIRLMCTLEHRNIVNLLGIAWNRLQNVCVIAEYMELGDLDEVLRKNKDRFRWSKEKLSISIDIALGLEYLHSLRPTVIHRDLKSKNVLMNRKMVAKLSDFGVSRKAAINETMTSGVGTLLWTAPEIIEGKKYTEKADIYSLGVVMSEIDTCDLPFASMKTEKGDRLPGMQLVQLVRTGKLKVSFNDDCPDAIKELAFLCTNLDPDLRPGIGEVVYALRDRILPMMQQR